MRTFAFTAWIAFSAVALAVAGLIAAPAVGLPRLIAENKSASMPVGYYVLRLGREPQVGDIVILPHPPNHREPWLVKWVVGMAPSTFCWREDLGTHVLDGRRLPPPVTPGPPPWKGCRKIAEGEVVGYGETPDSYDGRYLGPVPVEKLWGSYWYVGSDKRGMRLQAAFSSCMPVRAEAMIDVIPWTEPLGKMTALSK